MEPSGPEDSFSQFREHIQNRLLDARRVVINEALTTAVAGRISQQITVLEAESDEPVQVLMSNAPGGDVESGLSLYDLLRSMEAPVTILGSGRIAGAGVLCFVGVPSARRFALPHVQFQFMEPRSEMDPEATGDLAQEAERVRERRDRVVSLLTSATGQSVSQVESDVSAQRTFEADDAVDYGLIQRVVQNRREIQ
jgi:ATP-dependent Clp protease protease subunit